MPNQEELNLHTGRFRFGSEEKDKIQEITDQIK